MNLPRFNINWIIAIVVILALAGLLTWAWLPRNGQATKAPAVTTPPASL